MIRHTGNLSTDTILSRRFLNVIAYNAFMLVNKVVIIIKNIRLA